VLYYLGVMQMLIEKLGWALEACMGTTAGESLNAAGNIFVGMVSILILWSSYCYNDLGNK